MLGVLSSGVLGLILLGFVFKVFQWQQHYRDAQKLGFPVFYSPIWWKLLEPVLLPLAEHLPHGLTRPWLSVSQVWSIWKNGHKPFQEAGNDTFVLTSPDGNMIWTCESTVIQQLYSMHPKVEVPTEYLKFFEVCGPVLGSAEGDAWKVHRRAVSAGLGTAINKAVWEESRLQTSALVNHLLTEKGGQIDVVRQYTSALALQIIAGRFYDMKMSWDDREDAGSVPVGHQIRFDTAFLWTIRRIATLFITPKPLLGLLPGEAFKEASIGFKEMMKYINELRAQASQDIHALSLKRNKTMLESIILSASESEGSSKVRLGDDSVMGNIFFTMFAGHETTGGTLEFILLILAVYPEYQKRIQTELDNQFQARPNADWSFEKDFKSLQTGIIGAVQKEVLFIWEPSQFVLRRALEAITIVDGNGQSHQVPKGALFILDKAAHNNHPKMLQIRAGISSERKSALHNSPALYFNPERWIGEDTPEASRSRADLPYFQVFGDGNRACPGRGFAQTEMTAVMATLFKDYSLELVVNESTLQANQGNKQRVWEEVRDNAIKMLYEDVEANITLSINKPLPIRLVPRV